MRTRETWVDFFQVRAKTHQYSSGLEHRYSLQVVHPEDRLKEGQLARNMAHEMVRIFDDIDMYVIREVEVPDEHA